MAKKASPSTSHDFREVVAFLQEKALIPQKPSDALMQVTREIHANTYSLILWKFRLRLPERGQIFLGEIASDALQILPQVLMGFGKPSKLLIRGIVENTFRHLYFSDHPVEFARMNRDKKWYLTFEQLCEYARSHPIFAETERSYDAIAQASSLYSDLSAGVHGRTVHHLEMKAALKTIAYDESAARDIGSLLQRSVRSSNFLLAMFHRTRLQKFSTEDRRIILRSLPPAARTVWNTNE